MSRKAVFMQVLFILSLAVPASTLRAAQPGPLDLRLTDCLQWGAVWKTIPLSHALGQLGGCVEGGYVLFGLEQTLRDGKEPAIKISRLDIKQGTALGAALKQILRQLPPYEIEVVSDHLIDLYPKGAKKDPENLMNLRVSAFDTSDKDAYTILGNPRVVIPALDAALTPKPEPGKRLLTLYFGGYHPPGPPVTLHLKNATVRDILNAAAVASERFFPDKEPLGWVYTFDPAKSLVSGYRYTWGTLYSLPNGWSG
ncbi:MAG: hypothetical protein P8Z30_20255 [Acidobacteriota bacterium]